MNKPTDETWACPTCGPDDVRDGECLACGAVDPAEAAFWREAFEGAQDEDELPIRGFVADRAERNFTCGDR